MTPPRYPMLSKLNRLIASLGDLNAEQEVRAEMCRTLAKRADDIDNHQTGAQSLALPSVIKQLEASFDALLASRPIEDQFLRDLLKGDG